VGEEFPWLAKAASRLLGMHVTTCAAERNWSLFGNIFTKPRNRLALERATKLAFVRGNMGPKQASADEEIMMQLLSEPA
jgi:hypothetical protein